MSSLSPPASQANSASLTTEILQILTRKEQLSWSHFKDVFDALRARDANKMGRSKYERYQMQVVLESLGHADFRFDQSPRVSIRPATLTRLPRGGLPCAILCGARDGTTPAELQAACDKHNAQLQSSSRQAKAGDNAPARLAIEARSIEALEAVARELGIIWKPTPLAWECAQLAPTLGQRLEAGRQIPSAHLPWRARRFDSEKCESRAVYDADYQPQHGDFMAYATPENGVKEYRLVERDDAGELRWVPIGLSWGRYAALKLNGRRALLYDERKNLLAVPEGAPLPPSLARAAALCSGYAPELRDLKLDWPLAERNRDAPRWNFYRDVPPPIARVICEKLEQTPRTPDGEISRKLQNVLASFKT